MVLVCSVFLTVIIYIVQHAWTYKPLAHDVLGMRLNRITVEAPEAKAGQPPLLGTAAQPKSFEVCSTVFVILPF